MKLLANFSVVCLFFEATKGLSETKWLNIPFSDLKKKMKIAVCPFVVWKRWMVEKEKCKLFCAVLWQTCSFLNLFVFWSFYRTLAVNFVTFVCSPNGVNISHEHPVTGSWAISVTCSQSLMLGPTGIYALSKCTRCVTSHYVHVCQFHTCVIEWDISVLLPLWCEACVCVCV